MKVRRHLAAEGGFDLADYPAVGTWLDRVAGLMFIGFGLKLAVTDSPAA